MPKVLDEDDRLALLVRIAKEYPDSVPAKEMGVEDADTLRATLKYMEEKYLIEVSWLAKLAGKDPISAKATSNGYDEAERSGELD